MKIEYKIFLLVFLFPSFCFAATDETGHITRLIVEGNHYVSVWLNGPDDLSECSGGSRWTVHDSDVLFKEKLSVLLTAASSNQSIHLHGITGWGCGGWESNKIYYIDVKY